MQEALKGKVGNKKEVMHAVPNATSRWGGTNTLLLNSSIILICLIASVPLYFSCMRLSILKMHKTIPRQVIKSANTGAADRASKQPVCFTVTQGIHDSREKRVLLPPRHHPALPGITWGTEIHEARQCFHKGTPSSINHKHLR